MNLYNLTSAIEHGLAFLEVRILMAIDRVSTMTGIGGYGVR